MSGRPGASKRATGGRKQARKASAASRQAGASRKAGKRAGAAPASNPAPVVSVPAPSPKPYTPHLGANGKLISFDHLGRPTRCNPEIIADLVECIEEGLTYAAACDACLIPQSTFQEWQRRARVELSRMAQERERIAAELSSPEQIVPPDEIDVEPLPSERIFLHFLESIKKALAECRRRNLRNIRDAAPKSWQASAWMLERRFREEFGRPTADREPPPPPPGQQGNRPLDTGARIFEYYVNAPATPMPDFNEPEDLNPRQEEDD